MDDTDINETNETRPSKSARKRQMHALQAMGERLVSLPRTELDRITIPADRHKDAVSAARNHTARGG